MSECIICHKGMMGSGTGSCVGCFKQIIGIKPEDDFAFLEKLMSFFGGEDND